MKLSIILVLYNARDVIEVTLDAVFASRINFDYEVILVNNNSPDDTVDFVKQKYLANAGLASRLQFVELDDNYGFGTGVNRGAAQATGQYLLTLNTDTKLEPDNLQIMTEFMDSRPDVGAATCKLVKANGEIDSAARRGEPNLVRSFFRLFGLQKLSPKLFGGYNMLNTDPDQETELEALTAAYMMMRRDVFEQVKGFDERFFMYGEDLDLCRKIREAGYKIWWYPKTTCVHYKGQSSKKTPQKMLKAFYDAMWIYYKKWYSRQYWHLLDPLVFIGVKLLYVYKSMVNLFRKDKFVSK